ncbi:MAG: hypothetical protein R2843_01610 [Thermomicrobiales bacterium]
MSDIPIKQRALCGNTMLAVAALAMFLAGSAQTYGFSAYIDPLINEFDWSRSRISAGYSIATLLCAYRPSSSDDRSIDRQPENDGDFGRSLRAVAHLAESGQFDAGVDRRLHSGSHHRVFASLTLSARTLVPQWFVRRRGWAFRVATSFHSRSIPASIPN